MATIKAVDVINRAKNILNDANVRWLNDELQDWLNDAQKQIVAIRPDAYSTNASFSPTANQSKQAIPTGGIALVDVFRNTAASSKKRAIRKIERELLDVNIPDWHNSNATVNIEHYVYDSRDPKNFYLYPRPATGAAIDIIYSTVPTVIALSSFTGSDNTTIGLDDIYVGPIVDLICYRAFLKDAGSPSNSQRSVSHYQAAMAALGVKGQAEQLMEYKKKENKEAVIGV